MIIVVGTPIPGSAVYGEGQGTDLKGAVTAICPSTIHHGLDVVTVDWSDGQKAKFYRKNLWKVESGEANAPKTLAVEDCSEMNQKLFDSIPRYALGETPEELSEEDPALYRCTTLKRGLEAAYEDTIIPDVLIDALADFRHLCDRLQLDFAEVDKRAYEAYSTEVVRFREIRP